MLGSGDERNSSYPGMCTLKHGHGHDAAISCLDIEQSLISSKIDSKSENIRLTVSDGYENRSGGIELLKILYSGFERAERVGLNSSASTLKTITFSSIGMIYALRAKSTTTHKGLSQSLWRKPIDQRSRMQGKRKPGSRA